MREKQEVLYQCCGKTIHSPVLMRSHLELYHGVDTKTQKFTEQMISHLDTLDYYVTAYELSCDKVMFSKFVTVMREQDDLLAFDCNESEGE